MASADTCFSVEVKIGAKSSLEQVVKYALLEKSKMNNKLTSAELEAASRSMQVAHITFARFHEITKIYAGSISPDERYADSIRKLFDGLLHELEFRGDLLGIGRWIQGGLPPRGLRQIPQRIKAGLLSFQFLMSNPAIVPPFPAG